MYRTLKNNVPEFDRIFSFASQKSGRLLESKMTPRLSMISVTKTNDKFALHIPGVDQKYTIDSVNEQSSCITGTTVNLTVNTLTIKLARTKRKSQKLT